MERGIAAAGREYNVFDSGNDWGLVKKKVQHTYRSIC